MMIVYDVEQRSPEWHELRKGRVTASIMGDIMFGNQATWFRIAQRMKEGGGTSSYAMQRGSDMEPQAVAAYSLERAVEVRKVGFVLARPDNIGASPDGLIDPDGGLEIKCPLKVEKHEMHGEDVDAFVRRHYAQVQCNMYVCGRKWWDLVSFHPQANRSVIDTRVVIDPKFVRKMRQRTKEFYEFIKTTGV